MGFERQSPQKGRTSRRFTFGQGELERDIDDEMALHLDLLAEELVESGMEPGEARRTAESRFGAVAKHGDACRRLYQERRRESSRRADWRELLQDLRFSLRGFRRSPGFALLATLTLALGIGANTAIFSVLDAVLLEPLPYEESDRIVQVWETAVAAGLPKGNTSYPNFHDLRERASLFDGLMVSVGERPALTGLGEPRRIEGTLVSADFATVVRTPPLLGRQLGPEDFDGRRSCLLSYGLWNRLFGAERDVVGRAIELDGEAVTVVGVMPAGFDFPYGEEMWRPLVVEDPTAKRRSRSLDAFGRLKPGVSLEAAQAEADAVMRTLAEHYPETEDNGFLVESLRDAQVGPARMLLVFLLAAVGLLLLIASANVANLTLARAASRRRELAVRASLGAGRGRLLRQLLTESLVLALVGGAVGLGFAWLGLELFVGLIPESIPRLDEVGIDRDVLLFTWVLTMICGLVFGLIPALQVSRADLSDALKAGGKTLDAGAGGLRRGLVVLEVALALVLVVGAGLLVRSFVQVLAIDPGFDAEEVYAMRLRLPTTSYDKTARANFYERLAEETAALPQVSSAALVQRLPLRPGFQTSLAAVGGKELPENVNATTNVRFITADYFRTLGIRLLAGRPFDARDTADSPAVGIVNETFVRRFFPGQDPLGQTVDSSFVGRDVRIVGVVADVRQTGLEETAPASLYVPQARMGWSWMILLARTSAPLEAIAPELRARVWALDPRLATDEVMPLASRLDDQRAERRFTLMLLGAFAAAALVLAAIGIYGVIAQLVVARTREIGLRVALGAMHGDVMALVLKRGMVLALLGIGAGLAAAVVATRFIASLLYEVSVLDPLTFAAVPLGLGLVAFLASWIPARRALRVDPMNALRSE